MDLLSAIRRWYGRDRLLNRGPISTRSSTEVKMLLLQLDRIVQLELEVGLLVA